MTKIKSLTHTITTIPLISLSVVSLNFPFTAIADAVIPNNARTRSTYLIAQQATCSVVNIQTGQLALRVAPNGRSRAGLDNGDTVALLRQGTDPWVYVRVLAGPNNRVNGLEGWVNSDYLACNETSASPQASCEVVNIQTGQLALRVAPNGRSRAGLDNGNTVRLLREGSRPWAYVRVIEGPNRSINGLEGWVNSNYLSCYD